MREIVFRIWNGANYEHNVMVGKFGAFYVNPMNGGLDSNDSASISPFNTKFSDNVVIEQFTGLHDATKWEDLTDAERDKWIRSGHTKEEWKGRRIFEGDIMLLGDGTKRKTVIEYDSLRAQFVARLFDKNSIRMAVSFWSAGEIIGNIHDNPELLK